MINMRWKESLDDPGANTKIVAVTSCTSGLAHTYLAKEMLENVSKDMGVSIKIETQGAIGVENELTEEDIAEADYVLIASDIKILGEERFSDKKVERVPVNQVVRNPKDVLSKIKRRLTDGE